MLKPHVALEDIEHGLDDEALAQHDLVTQKHQMVAHVAPDAGDQVQAALPELGEQLAADVALVGIELAPQVLGDLVEHGAVGGVAGVIFSAMIWPLWLITKCSLRPKNQPMEVLPRAARPSKTLWRPMRQLWQTASLEASAK